MSPERKAVMNDFSVVEVAKVLDYAVLKPNQTSADIVSAAVRMSVSITAHVPTDLAMSRPKARTNVPLEQTRDNSSLGHSYAVISR